MNNQDTLCIIRLNCTFIKVVNGTALIGPSSQTYVYSCVKKEKILGYITLGIMFSPGILFAYLLYHGSKNSPKKYIIILISPVLYITFPLLVFLTKVRSQIFTPLAAREYSYDSSPLIVPFQMSVHCAIFQLVCPVKQI